MRNFLLLLLAIFVLNCAGDTNTTNNTNEPDPTQEGDKPTEKPDDESMVSQEEKNQALKNYMIPSASEIFFSLNKMDQVNWSSLANYNASSSYSNDYKKGLNLGTRVTDAFVAANAKDQAKFDQMSDIVFKLSDEMGMDQVISVEERNKLKELAGAGKWDELSVELDNIQAKVQKEMMGKGDFNKLLLAGAGGWFEGTRVISSHLKNDYDAETSKILSQGLLVEFMKTGLNNLEGNIKSDPTVSQVISGINEASELLGTEENTAISQENIEKLNAITTRVVSAIEKA